jgi:hypothetical protein
MALNCFLATWSGAVPMHDPFRAALIEAEASLRKDRDSLLVETGSSSFSVVA